MKQRLGIFVQLVAVMSLISFGTSQARANSPQLEGMGAISYQRGMFSSSPDKKVRLAAIELAKKDVIDRYAATFQPARYKLFAAVESRIKDDVDEYVTDATVVDEGYRKPEGKYYVVIRATLNEPRLSTLLGTVAGSARLNKGAARKISISFLFVARKTTSVRQYKNRVTKVTDDHAATSATQAESLHHGAATYSSSSEKMSVSTQGGSVLRKADQLTYAVTSPESVNAAMTKVFSDSGFAVYDYRDVSDQCGGAKPSKVYEIFSSSDALPRSVRKAVFDAARTCRVNTFAIGTLDVGLQDVDPVTGNKRVFVSVRSQVIDLSGFLPRILASVGPVQYSGLGPDQRVAMRNALQNAATDAAQQIADQLKSKGME